MLLHFKDNIESDHKKQADDLGLSQTELAFYNILIAELGSKESTDDDIQRQIKEVVRDLVSMLDDASQIVDFFSKPDALKTARKGIKHTIIRNFDESLVKPITDRFMELAEIKFK